MARSIALLMKDYDYLAPLACGDVTAEGLALKLTRDTPGALDRTLNDPSVQAGELSFSRHVHRLAAGDRSFVGIPFFAYRPFRHRCFFIRRDDGPRDFADLAGKRIGTNEWPASGNTWSRALIREAGVKTEELHGGWEAWMARRPSDPRGLYRLYVRVAPPDRSLRDMLLDGELDALMCPVPPKGFYAPNSRIVRLVQDYKKGRARVLSPDGDLSGAAHHRRAA